MNIYETDLKAEDAYLLARVSTPEQKMRGNSIPAQIERIRDYIERNEKLTLVEEYSFDESASKQDRKKFEKFLEKITRSKKTIAICASKVDRLLRDFPTWLPKLDRLRKEGLVELHFVSDHLIVHQHSPAIDLFQFNMAVALAQYFSDSISDNTRQGLEGKILKKEWPSGNIPRGYKPIKELVKDKMKIIDIIPDNTDAKIVQHLFQMYATGLYSLHMLRDWAYKQGFRGRRGQHPSHKLVADILQNPFYYGQMRFKNKLYPHKYKPLITEDLFIEVQNQFEKKRNNKTKNKQKVLKTFQSLIRCRRCGCAITCEVKKNGRYTIYSCTNYHKNCKRIYVNENVITEQIRDFFKSIQLSNEQIDELVSKLKIMNESHIEFHSDIIDTLQKQQRDIQDHIDSLLDKYTKPNSPISDEMYNTKLSKLKEEQRLISRQIAKHIDNDEEYHINARKILSLAQKADELFMSSEVEEKRQLVNFALSNLELDGKKLYFSTRSPFNEIINAKSCNSLGRLCDTLRTLDYKKINAELKIIGLNKKIEQFGIAV